MSSVSALGSTRFSTAVAAVNEDKWYGSFRQFAVTSFAIASQALGSVWGLLICKCIILVVSASDIYLTVKYVEFLPQMELNPVGRWLLSCDDGPTCELQNAAAFITAKFAGNVVVLAIIELLAHCKFRKVGCVVGAVTLFQILLGMFLFFADFSEV